MRTMNFSRIIKRFLDKILGTKSDEWFWRFRHFFDKDWAKSYINDLAINHPHRKLLVEEISKFCPFENILELGCASGANLFLLAKKYPDTKLYGIDVSIKAIEEGQKFFVENKIENVELQTRSILNLENFKDKFFDIVFSDATLLYIGKEKINNVFKEIIRVSKKGIVLCEQNTDKDSFYNDKWVHNYEEIISKIIPQAKISFIKISDNIWGGDWAKYGYIISVKF